MTLNAVLKYCLQFQDMYGINAESCVLYISQIL